MLLLATRLVVLLDTPHSPWTPSYNHEKADWAVLAREGVLQPDRASTCASAAYDASITHSILPVTGCSKGCARWAVMSTQSPGTSPSLTFPPQHKRVRIWIDVHAQKSVEHWIGVLSIGKTGNGRVSASRCRRRKVMEGFTELQHRVFGQCSDL